MQEKPFIPVASGKVVTALAQSAPKWRVPSSLAAEIMAPPKMTTLHVRGVYKALKELEATGRVKRKGGRWPDNMKFQLAP